MKAYIALIVLTLALSSCAEISYTGHSRYQRRNLRHFNNNKIHGTYVPPKKRAGIYERTVRPDTRKKLVGALKSN